MKAQKIFLIVLFMFSCVFAFSQEFNSKLLVKYDNTQLNEIKQTNPQEFDRLVYFATEACYIVDFPDKPINYLDLKKINPQTGATIDSYIITESDLENLNPLEYNILYDQSQRRYYKAGNTGKLIIVPSGHDMGIAIENEKRINKTK